MVCLKNKGVASQDNSLIALKLFKVLLFSLKSGFFNDADLIHPRLQSRQEKQNVSEHDVFEQFLLERYG